MVSFLERLKRYYDRHWLVGYDRHEFISLVEQFYLQITDLQATLQVSQHTSLKVILAESDSIQFLASFIAAYSTNCSIFLCNPFRDT